jgi:hypothetical protein
MAPKAVDARKRFDRNRRFRGHGPLLQQRGPIPRGCGASTAPVGGAHGPESGRCKEAPRPEPTLSRACPAPTTAWPIPEMGGASSAPAGGAHGPESGGCEETLRPEPSLLRAWTAPVMVDAPAGDPPGATLLVGIPRGYLAAGCRPAFLRRVVVDHVDGGPAAECVGRRYGGGGHDGSAAGAVNPGNPPRGADR